MKSSPHADENQHLLALLKKYKLWEKKSPFEHKSLLKALSNTLFLTKTSHEYLQKRLLAFFLANVKVFARDFKLNDFESIREFVQDFYLPQYQNHLLILCSKMVKAPIELYHPEDSNFRVETFGRFAKPPLRIIRLYDGHYSALFPVESKVKFSIAQNIILNIVERALTNPTAPFRLDNRNNGNFENFEYQEWLEHSMSNENFILMSPGQDSPLLSSPKPYFGLSFGTTPPTQSVGSKIISSLKNRKSKASFNSSEVSLKFDPDCEELLADLERVARKKDGWRAVGKERAIGHVVSREADRSPEVNIPRDVLEEYGETLFEPCDTFSYRDIEEILWKDTKNHHEEMWSVSMGAQAPPGLCPRTKSMTLGSHHKLDKVLSWNEGSREANAANMAWLDAELMDPRLGGFRSIDIDVDDDLMTDTTPLTRLDMPFKKAIKPSASETLNLRYKSGELNSLSMEFLHPFPPMEDPADPANAEKGTPSKRPKKKKKGESKVFRGELKFFDEKNNFGFILTNVNGKFEDVFVYRSEFDQAGIEMSTVRLAKHGTLLTFEFNLAFYFGKYQRSKKALNLRLVEVRRQPTE